MMKKITNFATILMLSTMLQSQTTIFVTPDGMGDGTSWATACNLETAVINAVSGDQIWAQKGTYYPTKMLVVPASVKIYGGFSGTETMLSQRLVAVNPVIIDGQQKIGSIFRLGKAAELHGLTITNGNANGNSHKSGGGVWADENCVIANCMIIHNTAALNGGGIYAKGKVEIINSTVKDNTANGNGNDMFGNCLMMSSEQPTTSLGVEIIGCNGGIPDFGEVSFKSDRIWTIPIADGNQEWSDVVMASGCDKTWYRGGYSGNYASDCRSNSDRFAYGDLFSWCAVARFAHLLCPDGWRVPTVEDFEKLDIALGGNGDGSGPGTVVAYQYSKTGMYYVNGTIRDKYMNADIWGGVNGGICVDSGELRYQGGVAGQWTLSEAGEYIVSPEIGSLSWDYGAIQIQVFSDKSAGFPLRCVR